MNPFSKISYPFRTHLVGGGIGSTGRVEILKTITSTSISRLVMIRPSAACNVDESCGVHSIFCFVCAQSG